MAKEPVVLDEAFATFEEIWSPRIAGTVNDYDVKIARGEGDFPEHAHADTDELFIVLEGELTLTLPDRTVVLPRGGVFTVPAGVRHQPSATPGTRLLFIEPRGVRNTGDDDDAGTTGHAL